MNEPVDAGTYKATPEEFEKVKMQAAIGAMDPAQKNLADQWGYDMQFRKAIFDHPPEEGEFPIYYSTTAMRALFYDLLKRWMKGEITQLEYQKQAVAFLAWPSERAQSNDEAVFGNA